MWRIHKPCMCFLFFRVISHSLMIATLLLKLLYIWVRKSARPSSALVNSVVEVVSRHMATQFDQSNSPQLFSEGVLLLGPLLSCTRSKRSKRVCIELLSGCWNKSIPLWAHLKWLFQICLRVLGMLCLLFRVFIMLECWTSCGEFGKR